MLKHLIYPSVHTAIGVAANAIILNMQMNGQSRKMDDQTAKLSAGIKELRSNIHFLTIQVGFLKARTERLENQITSDMGVKENSVNGA